MTAPAPTRPIVRYHGGKWMLAPWIIENQPPHRVFDEVYGGGGSVLLRKERSYAEIYNDLDSEIVNLFRQARDNGPELRRVLALTPYAREEYVEAWQPSEDPLEQARRTVIRAFMGFGSAAVTMRRQAGTKGGQPGTGFRANSNRSGTTPAHDWHTYPGTGFSCYTGETEKRSGRTASPRAAFASYPAALDLIIERLRGVVIENKDALEVLLQHDSENTLHYCDPPYVKSTRDAGEDYVFEMTDDDHRKMADCLKSLRGMVQVSGYHSPLYDELFKDWPFKEKAALADGAVKRVEVLWMNPLCAERLKEHHNLLL